VAAIRAFLSPFRLPGEAQKIDRIMCEFAARFCGQVLIPPSDPLGGTPSSRWCAPSLSAVQNVGVFADPDAAYVLGFSVIMLNTDAHSSQIKHKMTQQEFVRNNRGINAGGDLPPELLDAVYDDIVSCEIKTVTTPLPPHTHTL